VIYYGDEIGMGDNVFLADRDGVRTPMQWSNDRNAGFSRANPQSLYLPVVVDPQFHYETVNVEAQQANPNSLLWFVRNMIRLRQRHPVFGRGTTEFLSPDNEQVIAYLRDDANETMLIVANLTRHTQFVELDLSRFAGQTPTEMLGRTEAPTIGRTPYLLSIGPYGFYWFSIERLDKPLLSDADDVVEITGSLEGALDDDGALADVLGRFVASQTWYRGVPPRHSQTNVLDLIPVTPGEQDPSMWIALISIAHHSGPADLYVVPVAISFEPEVPVTDTAVMVGVRRDGVVGVLYDGLSDRRFRERLLEIALSGDTLLGGSGSLTCTAGLAAIDHAPHGPFESTVYTNGRGETYIDYGDGLALKVFRRVEPGTNPDLELRRFLTERTAFGNVADTYGALEYQSGDTYTVGIMQQSFAGAPTAWDAFQKHFHTWLKVIGDHTAPDDPITVSNRFEQPALPMPGMDALQPAIDLATRLGSTTARLHLALGSFSEDPDLGPHPFTQHYQQSLYQSLRADVRREFRAIRRLAGSAPPEVSEVLSDLIEAETGCLERLNAVRKDRIKGSRIRVHGDYRLDEIYLVEDEFVIEDFSGDHSRPMTERRLRSSGLSDVAQMVLSFDYVASASVGDGSPAQAWSARWSRQVGNSFLRSYLTDLADSALIPDSSAGIDNLLVAFMVSGALREVHWELANRPDWVHIPLAGIRQLLGSSHRSTARHTEL
jgi:maltose alpha-D-glucosyltransferase/alpha-amylase